MRAYPDVDFSFSRKNGEKVKVATLEENEYLWQGSRRRYIPDFNVRLTNGKTLALEIKGTDSQQNKAKREALDECVRAINSAGGFGQWSWTWHSTPHRCTILLQNMPLDEVESINACLNP